jgi:hypothetical protein
MPTVVEKVDKKDLTENGRELICQIPVEQRKRMFKSKAYRDGWLDSTMFWWQQLDRVFDNSKTEPVCPLI